MAEPLSAFLMMMSLFLLSCFSALYAFLGILGDDSRFSKVLAVSVIVERVCKISSGM